VAASLFPGQWHHLDSHSTFKDEGELVKTAQHSRRVSALLVAGAFAALVLPTLAGAEAPPSATPRSAEKVYADSCGYCHGRNVGPVILGRALPVPAIEAMVRGGLRAMPAFRPTEISDAELAAVAAWVSASPANPQEHGK